MRTALTRSALAAAALAFTGACHEASTVTDLNNIPANTIANGLTPSTFPLLVTGVINGDRADVGFRYIVFSETMARDVYNLDPSESRFITELLGPSIDPASFTGGSAFLGPYNTLATANTVLSGLAGLKANYGFTDAQVAATSGFIQTLKALQLYRVFETRGPNGVPADVATSVTSAPAPVLCQTSALARISALLDTANTNLIAAGSTAFPFVLPAGFSSNGDFSTPASFAKFTRGLRGRVEVYRGVLAQNGAVSSGAGAANFATAVTLLNASFLNATGDLSTGPYYEYSTAANETANPLAVPTIYLNPQVGDSIQSGDLRASKITKLSKARTLNRVSTPYKSSLADPGNQTAPIPILRNAELVLLRAQAEIGLGQLTAATADINAVRTIEGGLTAYAPFTNADAALRATLYEKRYSLLLTGAQRLVDLRSYGLLTPANFKAEIQLPAPDAFNAALPIPKTETDARGGTITLTCS